MENKKIASELLKLAKSLVGVRINKSSIKKKLMANVVNKFTVVAPDDKEFEFSTSGSSAEGINGYLFRDKTPWVEWDCYDDGVKKALGFRTIRMIWSVAKNGVLKPFDITFK